MITFVTMTYKRRKKHAKQEREARINDMSEKFNRLSAVTRSLSEKADDLLDWAPVIDDFKNYISSGEWLKDFEADERGEIGPDVDRSVLSEDGLYNLLDDIDRLLTKK